jgi:hypothetical protein
MPKMRESVLQMAMSNQEPERRLRLTGEDVHEGLREWVKADLKESPRQGYDLGKFFFSVSVGTIGALAAIDKLNQTTRIDASLLCALGILFASIIVSLLLALPKRRSIGGESDLHLEYRKCIARTITWSWIWFILWLAGAILGIWAVRR